MNPRWHRVLVQVFLTANSLFWLPWGLINLIWPESWAGKVIPNLDVYDLSSAVARTEVRAMYGGLLRPRREPDGADIGTLRA